MKRKRVIAILVIAVAIWILVSISTETVNPMEAIGRLVAEADDIAGSTRLTHEAEDANGNVASSPDSLAAAASETLGQEVGVEEYALARMVRNERTPARKGGNQGEAAAIVWVCINDAAANNGGDIVRCITGGKGFGKQGPRKYASGRNDPYDVDLYLVRRCLSGEIPDLTGGSTHFMHRNGFSDREDYLAVVAKWQERGWANVGLDVGTSLEVWT